MNSITKSSEDALPFNPDEIAVIVTKHFRRTWMLRWGWDQHDVREAMRDAYRISVGSAKYEILVRKKGEKKLIIVYDAQTREAHVITGTEG